jgi:hypothetical protein
MDAKQAPPQIGYEQVRMVQVRPMNIEYDESAKDEEEFYASMAEVEKMVRWVLAPVSVGREYAASAMIKNHE